MTSRRWWVLAFCLIACLGLLGMHWQTGRKDRITPANIARIEIGMTEGEVEEILGVPAGHYNKTSPPVKIDPDDGRCKIWVGDSPGVALLFEKGKVAKIDRVTVPREKTLRRAIHSSVHSWVERVFTAIDD